MVTAGISTASYTHHSEGSHETDFLGSSSFSFLGLPRFFVGVVGVVEGDGTLAAGADVPGIEVGVV